MRAIVTPALYSSIKFILKIDYEYHIRKRIQLLWRTLDSHQNLGGYVRTLCLTKVIKWDWSPLLSLLPNLQHLTIPSGAAAILRSAKLPLLSSLYYIRTRNDPRTDFPWEVLFRPNMRRWTFCFSYDHGDYRALNSLNSPPLPLNCVARSSPLTHIAITIGSCATAGVLDELLNWPAELLSFSFKGGWGGVAPEELSRALATHRASLKHLRLPLFPGDYEAGNHLLGYLDLKRFERLESLELQWTEVQRHPWITVAEYLPPNLIDLALTHTIKQTFNAEQQKWLIGLASILKTQISSLQFLKLDKLRIQEMIDLKNYTPINAIEHAWSEVGVIVTWVNAG
ncbi:hypothetical protein MMC17_005719 [Xylographa soralifera]|nr:hypothetical protein [Xylographa soralifera]